MTSDRLSSGLLALFLLIPAGPLVAGDGEDPARDASRGEYEALMSDTEASRAGAQTDLALDFDSRSDSRRPRFMSARKTATQDTDETRSGLSLDFASSMPEISLGMLQQDAPDDPSFHDHHDISKTHQPPHHENLAAAATNPVAALVQLQFQNNFVAESNAGDGYSNQFVVQPVIPFKIAGQQILSRITLPLLATPDLGAPIGREYGLGDTVALNAWVLNIDEGPWQGMWGPILTVTLPTATSDFTGAGKWQAGPGFIYINTATKGLQWGIFGYQQWSFGSAGNSQDRPGVSQLFFQPIITKHFDKGWYVAAQDILWEVDFNNSTWSLPIGVRVGRVLKLGHLPVNVFVEPYYDVSSNNPGNEWGVKVNFTLLFPN